MQRAKKFIGGLVIGGLLLGGGGLALATGNDNSAGNGVQPLKSICGPRMAGLKNPNSQLIQSVLADLVANGTLTQQQSDQIQSKQNEIKSERQSWWKGVKKSLMGKETPDQRFTGPPRTDLFVQLVNDGTITQDQVNAVKTAVQAKISAQRLERLQTVLDQLVTANVINGDQVAAIKASLTEQKADRQEQRENLRNMTPEQRRAFREDNRSATSNPLADLVEKGTISQDQANQVMKALRPAGGQEMHRGNGVPNK